MIIITIILLIMGVKLAVLLFADVAYEHICRVDLNHSKNSERRYPA
jgi:hypothetical protein